jgi:hypothetical protein
VPIKPGTDGALLLALVHEIIALGLYDRDFLARYTNAGQLVNQDEASDEFGLMLRNAEGDVVNPLRPANFFWWDRLTGRPVADHTEGADPALLGQLHAMPDGTPVPAFQLLRSASRLHAEWAAGITGIPAETIRRLAHEMGITARDQKIELPIAWTDCWGQRARERHRQPGGLPRHARAGGAQQRLPDHPHAGHPDEPAGHHRPPGGFRHKAPYPRAVPPNARPPKGPLRSSPTRRWTARRWAGPRHPDDLFVDAPASRCASTRASAGSTRCRRTG